MIGFLAHARRTSHQSLEQLTQICQADASADRSAAACITVGSRLYFRVLGGLRDVTIKAKADAIAKFPIIDVE
jgi:hypothetical protein